MSKKNKNNQQPRTGKDTLLELANLTVAKQVVISLPSLIQKQSLNLPLMEGYMKAKLKEKKVSVGQNFIALYLGKSETFTITEIDDIKMSSQMLSNDEQTKEEGNSGQIIEEVSKKGPFFVVGADTAINVINSQKQKKKMVRKIKDSQFYGYQQEVNDLKQSILNSLYQRQELIQNGLGPLKGILISGFSGAGKSALLSETKSILKSQKQQIYWKSISSVQMLSRVVGGAEEFIRNIFAQLKKNQPAVLTIEDIHLLFGAKQVASHETVLATLLGQLDNMVWQQVIVIATYNSDRDLTKSIRSSGKFQKQITINLPNHTVRLEILQGLVQKIHLKSPMSIEGLKKINLRLNGFSVGQIKQILREGFSHWGVSMTQNNFQEMLKKYRPAEIKELIVEVPEVYWNQIGGYQAVKKQIKKVVQLPLTHAAKFAKFGIEPSKGIMLYGPPGCSKTMMAKAIATESKLNFISIKGPQLFSKYVGQSERAIRNIFKRARACSPCVIFFDEIDALATQRSASTDVTDRVLCQLLNEMDGIEGLKEVAIVAATNRPEILDKALMRPGRFDYLIYVSPPDQIARKEIFSIYLNKSVKLQERDSLSSLMASKTADYTGAEISLICRQAVLLALQQNLQCQFIQAQHLQLSLKRVKKRLTKDLIVRYQQFSSTLKE